MSDSQANPETISNAVAKLYNTYPFPPEPLLDKPPPGYNWRWHWQTAYNFCANRKPSSDQVRILDAGCGTGVGTEYLVHLNPEAAVTGIDLSAGALQVAKERCEKSGATRVEFKHLSLFDAAQLEGEFSLINCVGVLHHTPDPQRGIQALADKLAPGGIMHIFVYGELGRWEISLMQEAISILQADKRGDYTDGVAIGRSIFAALPEDNRLKKREQERWSWENQRDGYFADMYVHPQEIDYNVNTVFELIDASGLEFVGFSNPQVWQLDHLIGQAPELIERAKNLSDRQRYRLIELLDPSAITHYEFFLAKPPFQKEDWSDDQKLLAAIAAPSPCTQGWRDSASFFNYDYQIVKLEDAAWQFLKACDRHESKSVAEVIAQTEASLGDVRSLQAQQVILLTPKS
ncbi:phycobiliprotein asparagine N-methyltransferase (plasmid) [Thalassoporum mexicanum PCC 7367]|uniref:class I SAM-dependent methyltransferase n=1 Tax=Thalassoporum mexicanum TaxID=3457544 RepID=UPI00029FE962|nr:class I SAM-dependent methyltransferase [Pseudanabaena sp. PCC 7367]AFY72130.1 phycobiliprotein asparagine N-methyltransferase [Pseudanabaena sp. PCC 7367]